MKTGATQVNEVFLFVFTYLSNLIQPFGDGFVGL